MIPLKYHDLFDGVKIIDPPAECSVTYIHIEMLCLDILFQVDTSCLTYILLYVLPQRANKLVAHKNGNHEPHSQCPLNTIARSPYS